MKEMFLMYHSYEEYFDDLSAEELQKIIKAIFKYERTREEPNFEDRLLKIVFQVIKENLDKDRSKRGKNK